MARGPTILTRFGAHVRGALRALAGLRALAALALLAVVGLRVLDPAALETARLNTFDAFQQINPRDPGESRVAIVDIDEASLAEFGQWPWSRDRMARLVAQLDAAEAAAIGFDIVFSEADRLSPDAFALETPGLPGMVRGVLAGLPNTDAAFAAAIAATPTVLGMSANTIPPDPDRPPLRAKSPLRAVGGDPRPHLFAFPSALRNIAPLEEAARAVGMFSLTPEPDGAVRRVPLAVRAGGRVHPSLSLETLRLAQGAEAGPARIEMRPG
ncbi:MAG: CHASE2 domain-containing protein, partial [Pseudomonadota bacterium]